MESSAPPVPPPGSVPLLRAPAARIGAVRRRRQGARPKRHIRADQRLLGAARDRAPAQGEGRSCSSTGRWELHSENATYSRPVVIRLASFVRVPRDAHRRKITRRAVFARDEWTCQYCGSRSKLTVDHVIPRSKGGPSGWENIVASCAPCNRRKGDQLPRAGGHGPPAHRRTCHGLRSSSTSPARRSRRPGAPTSRRAA